MQYDDDQDPANYAKKLAKAIVQHIALAVAVVLYVVLGAFLFIEIEGDTEDTNLAAAQNRCVSAFVLDT